MNGRPDRSPLIYILKDSGLIKPSSVLHPYLDKFVGLDVVCFDYGEQVEIDVLELLSKSVAVLYEGLRSPVIGSTIKVDIELNDRLDRFPGQMGVYEAFDPMDESVHIHKSSKDLRDEIARLVSETIHFKPDHLDMFKNLQDMFRIGPWNVAGFPEQIAAVSLGIEYPEAEIYLLHEEQLF